MEPFIQVSVQSIEQLIRNNNGLNYENIGMKAATATLGIIRPSVVEYYDEMDSDDARHESVGVLGRTFMSLNIASSVRVAKVVTIASLGYFLFQRYLKDYANEFAQKFLKGSN